MKSVADNFAACYWSEFESKLGYDWLKGGRSETGFTLQYRTTDLDTAKCSVQLYSTVVYRIVHCTHLFQFA